AAHLLGAGGGVAQQGRLRGRLAEELLVDFLVQEGGDGVLERPAVELAALARLAGDDGEREAGHARRRAGGEGGGGQRGAGGVAQELTAVQHGGTSSSGHCPPRRTVGQPGPGGAPIASTSSSRTTAASACPRVARITWPTNHWSTAP